ncbi:hypothetical protein [Hoeflea sp. TYP-13]|uniref:hypothetical protein n=1 Tax=Hoeflea sp. TYP-13 TaxID=3230023 RepID=UPI0034C69BE4
MNRYSSHNPADSLDMMVKARLVRWRLFLRTVRSAREALMSRLDGGRSRPNPLTMRGLDIS